MACSYRCNVLECQSLDEQRILHLSVQPSAWTSAPPGSCEASVSSPQISSTHPLGSQPRSIPQLSTGPVPDETLAFIRFKHWQALYMLSNSKLCPPEDLPDVPTKRSLAKLALERRGYVWPTILDSDSPSCIPTSQGHVDYDIVTIR